MELNITIATKDILDVYDADKLLSTISHEYSIPASSIKVYSQKANPVLSVSVSLSTDNINHLKSISQNLDAPISLVFNFLIENVCDCSKIQTKKIAHALENYYKLIINHDDQVCGSLLNRILEEYGNSGFYNEEEGLSEKDIANFLTLSNEGKNIVQEIDKLRGIE